MSEGSSHANGAATGNVGCLVAISLPRDLAEIIAAGQPIIELLPKDLENGGLRSLSFTHVACPLFGSTGDAVQVIESLSELGFAGSLTVVAPRLPNAKLVEKELRMMAQGIKVRLISP